MRMVVPMAQGADEVVVRFYDKSADRKKVVEFERTCECGDGDKVSILQDPLGDPLCRVRHYPSYAMLVAEIGDEIIGIIRAGIKVLVCGKKGSTPASSGADQRNPSPRDTPIYTRAGYILGLRVSAAHRRMGIGLKLATKMEEWCKEQEVDYVYFVTTKHNEASVSLFTKRLQYVAFRNPAILIQPVFVHARPIPGRIEFIKLSVKDATAFYRSRMGTREFFPEDIDRVLGSNLCAGTWIATIKNEAAAPRRRHRGNLCCGDASSRRVCENSEEEPFEAEGSFLGGLVDENGAAVEGGGDAVGGWRPQSSQSWAVLSLWKCDEIFKFEVQGVSLAKRYLAYVSRALEKALPWFRLPSIPDLFNSFGMQFIFGLHAEGPHGHKLMKALCWHAHNLSRDSGCRMLMTEVGADDPLKRCIPHWDMFSCEDDVLFVKDVRRESGEVPVPDVPWSSARAKVWSTAPSAPATFFMDPRDV